MASADQLKALIQSHVEGDEARFYRVALQLAAHHSRLGHDRVARELKEMIDSAPEGQMPPRRTPTPLARPRGPLEDLLHVSYPDLRLSDVVLPPEIDQGLHRLLEEHRSRARLANYGLLPRRKLLFSGPPGTGKTLTARALSGELQLPLFLVRFDALIAVVNHLTPKIPGPAWHPVSSVWYATWVSRSTAGNLPCQF